MVINLVHKARAQDGVAQGYMRTFVRARANRMQPGRKAASLLGN